MPRNQIGIMNGRLSKPIENKIQAFPINLWKDEFRKAKTIGFDLIEWVFDSYQPNPILNDEGILEIKSCIKQHDVNVHSVCADYFMEHRLFGVSSFELEKNIDVFKKLIRQCQKLEIGIIDLPLVDSSSIKLHDKKTKFVKNLKDILNFIEDHNITIALETDLEQNSFKQLLLDFDHHQIMINYDIGNSTANQFDIKSELYTLKHWIVNVHIKDRKKNGPTVPLGTGDVNFDTFFSTLDKIQYDGDLIIQGAREDLNGKNIEPETTCSNYLKFVNKYM